MSAIVDIPMDDAELIERLYEAPFQPDLWQSILTDLARLADAEGGLLSGVPFLPKIYINTPSLDPLCETVSSHSDRIEPGLERGIKLLPSDRFSLDRDLVDANGSSLVASYAKIFKDCGLGETVLTCIRVPTDHHVCLILPRRSNAPPLTAEHFRRLDLLQPHIARAIKIATKVEFEEIRNRHAALQTAGFAAAAVCPDGRALAHNTLFTRMGGQISLGPRNQVILGPRTAQESFEEALRATRLASIVERRSLVKRQVISLGHSDQGQLTLLHILPSSHLSRDLFTGLALILVAVPAISIKQVSSEIVESLFSLTGAEARIARALANGDDVRDIASHYGITTETVRRHLKNIYSKTGMSRQAELSATIAGLRLLE